MRRLVFEARLAIDVDATRIASESRQKARADILDAVGGDIIRDIYAMDPFHANRLFGDLSHK